MRTHLVYTILAASLSTLTLSYLSYYIIHRKRLQQPPKSAKWQYVGTIGEIALYPVRSGAAILVNEVQCKVDGLYVDGLKDRGLILNDENGKKAFAGVYPHMLGITTEILDKNTIVLKGANMECLTLNLDQLKLKPQIVKHEQNYKLHLVEGEVEHHEWFSKVILNKSHGLKLFTILKTDYKYNFLGEDTSDFIPIMIMNNKSVNDLNRRLPAKNAVHHLQFRGNALIKTAGNVEPYAEDNWTWLRIGDNKVNIHNCILRYHAPCLRCILPNIDIQTCKRSSDFEPLKTLKKYRRVHNSKEPTLGAHYKVYQEGLFKLNDPVYAIYKCT